MASSSSPRNIKFCGPADEEFDSLQEQAAFFSNTYWQNWNNYDDPQSCVIPPIFCYKHSEISDEKFSIALEHQRETKAAQKEENGKTHAVVKDRISDDAEHIVFDATFQLAQERFKAPFIAVQNFNLSQIQALLRQIFPKIDWQNYKLREYDYVLIGPKIGIVVIEVKSQSFLNKKDFVSGKSFLPDQYVHGIHQLNSVKPFLSLLEKVTGIVLPHELPVNKVLFTPNLEEKRFLDWKATLDKNFHEQVNNMMGDVIQWFKESTINSSGDSKKPPLYTKLQEILESGSEILDTVYESYGLLIATLASIIEWPSPSPLRKKLKLSGATESVAVATAQSIATKSCSITLDPIKLSDAEAILKECSDLDKLSNIMFLTPDQQAALNGPKRQFIIGAAGTGKTIVLKAKALQLLRNGESILVLSPESYMERYKELFDSHGLENYEVRCWEKNLPRSFHPSLYEYIEKARVDKSSIVEATYNSIKQSEWDYDAWLKDCFMCGSNYRHVLIDDGYDNPGVSHDLFDGSPLIIMALAKHHFPEALLWIAGDVVTTHSNALLDNFRGGGKIEFLNPNEADGYSVAKLKRVMRYTEHIFNYVKQMDKNLQWPEDTEPLLGHKILGQHIIIDKKCGNQEEALQTLWDELIIIFKNFPKRILENKELALFVLTRAFAGYGHDQANVEEFLRTKYQNYFGQNAFVPLYDSLEVSSLEWPVVIIATYLPMRIYSRLDSDIFYSLPDWNILYAKYRASTRAMAKLITIMVTYPDDDDDDDDDDEASNSP